MDFGNQTRKIEIILGLMISEVEGDMKKMLSPIITHEGMRYHFFLKVEVQLTPVDEYRLIIRMRDKSSEGWKDSSPVIDIVWQATLNEFTPETVISGDDKFERIRKYLPKDVTHEEWEAGLEAVKESGLIVNNPFNYPNPLSVIFRELEEAKDEARHREIIELLSNNKPVLSENKSQEESSLSERDKNILSMWEDGFTAKEIGEAENLAPGRVRNIITELRKKLGSETVKYHRK